MVPADRRQRRRLGSAAGAATISSKGGLSVQRNSMLKRAGAAGLPARAEDDGFCLDDEVVITILSRVAVAGSTTDLVRCAATCRRWRRLVSTNAAFICRHAPRPIRSKGFVRFFHLNNAADAAAPRSLWLGKPLFGGLVRGYGHRVLDASSRVVASRGGLLAAEIRRAGIGSVLRLRVCNPGSGEVDVLPCLRGNDRPGPYACALLTADDLRHFQDGGTPPPRSAASYRLLLVYNRRGFTAARCFSSDAGGWGPEAQVSGARIGRKELHATRPQATRAAIVHRGVVFWPRLRVALVGLPADEGAAAVRGLSTSHLYEREGSMLGLMPDGKLCWVDMAGSEMRVSLRSHSGDMICLHDGSLNGRWLPLRSISLPKAMPEYFSWETSVTLRWFYEESGIIFFTATKSVGGEERCYTLNVSTNQICEVSRSGASEEPWGDMCGYELDREKFLGSLRLGLKRN